MAGRKKQPVELLEAKGRKHLTKAEKKQRMESEIKAPADEVLPPTYLNSQQKKVFKKLAKSLVELNIMSNLDCDTLARFCIAREQYIRFTELVDSINSRIDALTLEEIALNIGLLDKASSIQNRAFKQCRDCASDLGLTITSRCKLVVPKAEEKKQNKFLVNFGDTA